MTNIDQFSASYIQSSNLESPDKPHNHNRLVLVTLFSFVCIMISGFIGFQLGQSQRPISPSTSLTIDQISNNDKTVSDQSPVAVTSTTEPSNANSEMANCKKTYTSKYLVLSFEYNSCDWKIDERPGELDSGFYSSITATNQDTKLIVGYEANGMGGGYPDCKKVENIVRIGSDIVRFRVQDNQYLYLLKGNDFAIQGFSGDNGEKKFQNYFTFMHKDAFPDANLCYRSGGVNPVRPIKASDDLKYGLDIRISAVSQSSDELSTSGADMIVQSIASYLEK